MELSRVKWKSLVGDHELGKGLHTDKVVSARKWYA